MQSNLISDLAIVSMVAAVTGMVSRRIGQPTILGYLFAGLIVGPYIPVPLFADPHRMQELAEVGVVLVMFAVGLEFRMRRLLEILPVSGLTAAAQIGALWWAGYTVGSSLGWTNVASICLGATVAISSTMVVSAILRSNPIDPDIRGHVFGILVVQDVVAIVLMAIVTALASGQNVGLKSLGLLLGQLSGVVIAMLVVGLLVLPRLVRFALRQSDSEMLVVLVAGAAFGLAMAAHAFGYSVALGAFVAGMAVAESGRGHDVEKAIEPLRALFSAIFFVSIGMTVDPVVAWKSMPLALILCGVVIGTQFVSVAVATVLTGSSLRRGVYSGLALGQIGELSFILATIAIAGKVVPKETLPALVTVATITAFTTPLLLKRAPAIVGILDRWLPDRAHEVLAAYQAFVRRNQTPLEGASLRKPAFAVVLDWSALIVLVVVRHTIVTRVQPQLVSAVNVGAAVVATPFLIGLIRSGRRLVLRVRARTGADETATPWAKVVEALALVAIVVGVGVPTVAALSPLMRGAWIEAALLGLLLATLVLLGLRLGRVKGDHTSGVAHLALGIADQMGEPDSSPASIERGPLAGLDYEPIRIAAGTVDGRTLAELNLRCATGATVIAVSRGGVTTTLPTGSERLHAEDVLAVSGAPAAIERVRALLGGTAAPRAAG